MHLFRSEVIQDSICLQIVETTCRAGYSRQSNLELEGHILGEGTMHFSLPGTVLVYTIIPTQVFFF